LLEEAYNPLPNPVNIKEQIRDKYHADDSSSQRKPIKLFEFMDD
jgi:hypothetical protein